MKLDYMTRMAMEARKRRGKLYRDFLRKKLSVVEFAKLNGMSRQRMQILIGKAKQDSVRL